MLSQLGVHLLVICKWWCCTLYISYLWFTVLSWTGLLHQNK